MIEGASTVSLVGAFFCEKVSVIFYLTTVNSNVSIR